MRSFAASIKAKPIPIIIIMPYTVAVINGSSGRDDSMKRLIIHMSIVTSVLMIISIIRIGMIIVTTILMIISIIIMMMMMIMMMIMMMKMMKNWAMEIEEIKIW